MRQSSHITLPCEGRFVSWNTRILQDTVQFPSNCIISLSLRQWGYLWQGLHHWCYVSKPLKPSLLPTKKRFTLSDIFSGLKEIIRCCFRFVGFMFPLARNLPHKKRCAFCVPLHLGMKLKPHIYPLHSFSLIFPELKLDTQRGRSTVP